MDFIFDFDGTLLNTKACMKDALKETLNLHQIQAVSDASLNRFVEDPNLIFTIDTIHGFSDQDLSDFLEMYRKQYLLCRKTKARLFPDVKDTLKILKTKGSKLFLVSNSNTDDTILKLHQLGIENLFDAVVSSDTLHVFKPHPFVVEHLIEMYDLHRKNLVMVGDSPNDIKMAQASGIRALAILSGISSKDALQLEAPTAIISSIAMLLSMIQDHGFLSD